MPIEGNTQRYGLQRIVGTMPKPLILGSAALVAWLPQLPGRFRIAVSVDQKQCESVVITIPV
jgi:hypothetical protein